MRSLLTDLLEERKFCLGNGSLMSFRIYKSVVLGQRGPERGQGVSWKSEEVSCGKSLGGDGG